MSEQFMPFTMQAAAAATGNGVVANCENRSMLAMQVTGTFVGTITFEATVDGTNYVAIEAVNMADGTKATSIAAPALLKVAVAGLNNVRARISAYTSGAITVTANSSRLGGLIQD